MGTNYTPARSSTGLVGQVSQVGLVGKTVHFSFRFPHPTYLTYPTYLTSDHHPGCRLKLNTQSWAGR